MVAFSKPLYTYSRIGGPMNYKSLCFHNAMINLIHMPEHKTTEGQSPHRLTAGALTGGIYNNRTKKNELHKYDIYGATGINDPKHYYKRPTDVHCWIEDADGRIWDYLSDAHYANLMATKDGRPTGATPTFKAGTWIEGMTPAEIWNAYKLTYTSTSINATRYIYNHAWKRYMPLAPRPDDKAYFYIRPFIDDDEDSLSKDALEMMTLMRTRLDLNSLMEFKHDRQAIRNFFFNEPPTAGYNTNFTILTIIDSDRGVGRINHPELLQSIGYPSVNYD
jgi:hypothetical protein